MNFYDFQLNVPAECIKYNLPDQMVNIYYGVKDGKVTVVEIGVVPLLATLISDWEGLEKIAQSVAEEIEANKGNENFVQELESVMK